MKFFAKTIIAILVISSLQACTTPIGLITAHPDYWNSRSVVVKGKVISTMRLEDLSIFTIKQSGQRISIVTNDFLPVINDIVKVKGKVDNKFYYQRDTLLVIKETVEQKKNSKPNFNKSVN